MTKIGDCPERLPKVMLNSTSQPASAAIFVSLGANARADEVLLAAARQAEARGLALVICLLDDGERINLTRLWHNSPATASLLVAQRVLRFNAAIDVAQRAFPRTQITTLLTSELRFGSCSAAIEARVRDVLNSNASFQRLCCAEVFRNLQPLLRRRGITSPRHRALKTLVEYVLLELVSMLTIFSEKDIRVVLGLGREFTLHLKLLDLCEGQLLPAFVSDVRAIPHAQLQAGGIGSELELRDVGFRYPKGHFGLRKIQMKVSPGEALGLFGPSGSGKSTLLSLIGAHSLQSSGEILLNGRPLREAILQGARVVTIFQDLALFPHLTVASNVAYGLASLDLGSRRKDALVNSYLDLFHIREVATQLPSDISGGQQRRTALARALIVEPNVLLMDEPDAGLDSGLRAELLVLLRQTLSFPPVPAMIVVSHNLDFLLSVAGSLCVLDDGEVLQCDVGSKVLSSPASQRVAQLLAFHGELVCRREDTKWVVEGEDRSRWTPSLDGLNGDATEGGRVILVSPLAANVVRSSEEWHLKLRVQGVEIRSAERWVVLHGGPADAPTCRVRCRAASGAMAEFRTGEIVPVKIDADLCKAVPLE